MATIDQIQNQATTSWKAAGCKGTIVGATGTGKSKIALDRIKELFAIHGEKLNVLLAVPTKKLRDNNWPADAKKWQVEIIYDLHVQGVCYVSTPKVAPQHFHLVVLDEGHHSTDRSMGLFDNITFDELMVLTATKGDNNRLDQMAPVVFNYPVEEAVKDNVVNDFEVHVVQLELDDIYKTITAGRKEKPFKVTEKRQYKYLEARVIKTRIALAKADEAYNLEVLMNGPQVYELEKARKKAYTMFQLATSARAQFIYGLPSKTRWGKKILENIIKNRPGKRTIVFCGSIKQSEQICGRQVYHSKSSSEYYDKFKNEEIDYLGAVNALDEGENLNNVDFAITVQASSVQRRLIQRLGRIIRRREGVVSQIYILQVLDTVDEQWVNSALEGIDPSKITKYRR